ncbi:MAG: glycogen(starch) synthase [Candidatus Woesearchaeota archaeon]|jgi:glycogen(starch) synthase
MNNALADCVFEVSYETCHKVGGIYTVISSKALQMKKHYSEYYLIGEYFPNSSDIEFASLQTPTNLIAAFEALEKKGVTAHFGKWLIKGEPNVILLSFNPLYEKRNDWRQFFWDNYQIDSIKAGHDFDEPMLLSVAAGMLIEEISRRQTYAAKKIICHSHEWMCGFTNLYLRTHVPQVKTVFTTHATMLGRSLSGSGAQMYSEIETINPQEEAQRLGIMEKFTAERACAQQSDVFTTVSDITGIEATYFLGRKPDILVLNGLDMEQFPSFEQAAITHAQSKEKIKEFLQYYFFPYHTFNTDKTTITFCSGRNEFKNKGIDSTIKALGELNKELVAKKSDKTVVCFFWVPYETHGIKKEVLENKIFYRNLYSKLEQIQKKIHKDFVTRVLTNIQLNTYQAVDEEHMHEIRHMKKLFQRYTNQAPLCTHYIPDEENNEVIRAFRDNGLTNSPENKVKVIYYPVYLNGADGLLDMDYYQSINGTHLGLFPSYYEPWGYTPLEGAALAIPVITTDTAGFGQFIKKKMKKSEGIFILERLRKHYNISQYVSILSNFISLTHHERVKHKISAKLLSEHADWAILVDNYIQAHNLALTRNATHRL